MSDPKAPLFVPIVLAEDEVLHVLGALSAVLQSVPNDDAAVEHVRPMASAMLKDR